MFEGWETCSPPSTTPPTHFGGYVGTVPDSKQMTLPSNVTPPTTHTHTTESKALTQGPMQIEVVSMGTETPVCFPSPALCNFQQVCAVSGSSPHS